MRNFVYKIAAGNSSSKLSNTVTLYISACCNEKAKDKAKEMLPNYDLFAIVEAWYSENLYKKHRHNE